MVVLYPDGSSFTGEESAEIFCHGGPVIVDSIVGACVDLGAVHAGPGDFTRRAVANGRMDLVQAEAVALLVDSSGESAVDVALQALEGRASARILAMSSDLLDMLADCEASLDFDESDELYVDLSGLGERLAACAGVMDGWIRDARSVRPAVSGFRVVLSGAPNVGKSTLFNVLAGREVAIVHDEPGTTRDVISESMVLAGVPCLLFDTAGIRETDGRVEAEGVRRALQAAADADLVLYVAECGSQEAILAALDDAAHDTGRIHAVVLSKADLAPVVTAAAGPGGIRLFVVSAREGRGVAELLEFISSQASGAVRSGAGVAATVAGERQTGALRESRWNLAAAAGALTEGAPPEVVAGFIRDAVQALGEITGSRITEEVLDRIFLKFCVGK